MVLLFCPVNHRAPSGPVVIQTGVSSSPFCNALVVESTTVNAGGVAVVPRQILALQIHRLPSGPSVRPLGALSATGISNKVTTPAGVTCPMLLSASVNHRLPSFPAMISSGWEESFGMGNSVIAPVVVIWPTFFCEASMNHREPSGPAVIPWGVAAAVGMGYSVILPLVVMRPILLLLDSVNHIAPSGPAAILRGAALPVGGSLNSVILSIFRFGVELGDVDCALAPVPAGAFNSVSE